jgi:hypothetical protein
VAGRIRGRDPRAAGVVIPEGGGDADDEPDVHYSGMSGRLWRRWREHNAPDQPIMSSNGVPIQDISDTVGHKSTHVTETGCRHVIVPEIRGGATVMDDVFNDDEETQTRPMEKAKST